MEASGYSGRWRRQGRAGALQGEMEEAGGQRGGQASALPAEARQQRKLLAEAVAGEAAGAALPAAASSFRSSRSRGNCSSSGEMQQLLQPLSRERSRQLLGVQGGTGAGAQGWLQGPAGSSAATWGEAGEAARGFEDEYSDVIHDISDLKRRAANHLGHLLSWDAAQRYVQASSAASLAALRSSSHRGVLGSGLDERRTAVVARSSSYMGELAEGVLPYLEVAEHLLSDGSAPSAGRPPPASSSGGLLLLFPADREERGSFSQGIRRLLLGAEAAAMGGQVEGRQVCFANVLFPLNHRHTAATADLLRHRAFQSARLQAEQAAAEGQAGWAEPRTEAVAGDSRGSDALWEGAAVQKSILPTGLQPLQVVPPDATVAAGAEEEAAPMGASRRLLEAGGGGAASADRQQASAREGHAAAGGGAAAGERAIAGAREEAEGREGREADIGAGAWESSPSANSGLPEGPVPLAAGGVEQRAGKGSGRRGRQEEPSADAPASAHRIRQERQRAPQLHADAGALGKAMRTAQVASPQPRQLQPSLRSAQAQPALASALPVPAPAWDVRSSGWHVTVLQRDAGRAVRNMRDVVQVAHHVFPELPVFVFSLSNSSVLDMMHIMKHSLVTISLFGSPLASLLFMPRASVVVELLPLRLSSSLFRKLALRSGLLHLAWLNTHREAAAFRGDCLRRGGFEALPAEECSRARDCLACVRDRGVTKVHARELLEVLRNARVLARQFLPLAGQLL